MREICGDKACPQREGDEDESGVWDEMKAITNSTILKNWW
jgi:hypothetical protein